MNTGTIVKVGVGVVAVIVVAVLVKKAIGFLIPVAIVGGLGYFAYRRFCK